MEKETKQTLSTIRQRIAGYQKYISASSVNIHGLRADGTVICTYIYKESFSCTEEWRNIVEICDNSPLVGLRADGTVVSDMCAADLGSNWQNIIAACSCSGVGKGPVLGLKADGTVVAAGDNKFGERNVQDWQNIVAVCAGYWHTAGLKADGTVVAAGYNESGQCDVQGWKNIVAIFSGKFNTFGLKSDGTILAVGSNEEGQCNVQSWQDIITVSAGEEHTVGLKSDGTVVAVGNNEDGRCAVQNWQNIVAICAGREHTVGLKSDGTVVAVGNNEDGRCAVQNWQNIVAIFAVNNTVGLKEDGTVTVIGDNKYGQCDTQNWRDIGPLSEELCLKRKQEDEEINKTFRYAYEYYMLVKKGMANNTSEAVQQYNEYLKTYLSDTKSKLTAFILYKKLRGKNLNSLTKEGLLEILAFVEEEDKEIRKHEESKENAQKKVNEYNEKLKRVNWFDRKFRKKRIAEIEKSLKEYTATLNEILSNEKNKTIINLFPAEYQERPDSVDYYDLDDWRDGHEHPLLIIRKFIETGMANSWQESVIQYERYKIYLQNRVNQKYMNKKTEIMNRESEILHEKTEETKKAAEWAAWMAWSNRN